MIESREALIATARSYKGVRWMHQGRSAYGLDCIGLIIKPAEECGVVWRDPSAIGRTNYRQKASNDELKRLLGTEGLEVGWDDLRVGDVVLFYFPRMDYPQHVGYVSGFEGGAPILLHADIVEGKVCERTIRADWKDAFLAGFRLWDLV